MDISQQSYADTINLRLKDSGTNLTDQPLYRLVWSDNELEFRRGIFREFVGNIFVRETVGVKQVPKYSYIKARWILERWIPPDACYNPEIPNSQWGSYEPIYVFQDKNGNSLPFSEKVVYFIITLAEKKTRVTPEERLAESLAKEEAEINEYLESLEISPITNALHMKEAVGYSPKVRESNIESEN
jgi:hypothetical protein